MAKTKTIKKTKLKTSIFLCCLCPPPPNDKDSVESLITATTTDPIIVQKQNKRRSNNNWLFSWVRIRFRENSASKTVPLVEEAHYSKVNSKSTLHHKSLPLTTQALPVHPATPYYTPSQTRHGPSNNTQATRQQGRDSPTTQDKRQSRRVSSSSMQHQTTSSRKQRNAKCSNDNVSGMSVVVVMLVILIFWGRICAILCTSVWLYCIPRFRNNGAENDESTNLIKNKKNEVVDMDSEEYKKKVIMEGLLERNHNKG